MGMMKTMMMDAGSRNAILIYADEVARWTAATGSRLLVMAMKLEASGSGYAWHHVLAANDARRLANDPRVAECDREEIRFRLEVGGLPTGLPPDPSVYTMADRLSDLRYMAVYVWPARLWASGVVATAAATATAARRLGFRRLAMAAVWYAYDVADHDPADDTWGTIMRFAPWAWTADERFRPAEQF